jgi:hypothetical protein
VTKRETPYARAMTNTVSALLVRPEAIEAAWETAMMLPAYATNRNIKVPTNSARAAIRWVLNGE